MIGDPTKVGDIAEFIGPMGDPTVGHRVVVTAVIPTIYHKDGWRADREVVTFQPYFLLEDGHYHAVGAGTECYSLDKYLKPIRDAAPPEAATIADELEFLI